MNLNELKNTQELQRKITENKKPTILSRQIHTTDPVQKG